ncbi:hypothetical protein HYX58_05905 [Candidatus Dependentiae bacterium]|nr:hypothetical protein [Candidatus Dependentiae bacterium]
MLKIILLPIILISAFSSAMEQTNETAPAPLTEGTIKYSSLSEKFIKDFSEGLQKNPKKLLELINLQCNKAETSKQLAQANPSIVNFLVEQSPLSCTKHLYELPTEPHSFAACAKYSANGYQDSIHLIDGPIKRPLKGHRGTVSCLKFIKDGDQLISADHEGNICIWDTKSGTIENVFKTKQAVTDLVLNHKETLFASVGRDTNVNIWEIPTAKSPETTSAEILSYDKSVDSTIVSVAFGEQDTQIAGGLANGKIAFWDIDDKDNPHISKQTHSSQISSLAYKGNLLVSAACDSTVNLWDAKQKKLIKKIKPFDNEYVTNFKPLDFGIMALTNKGKIYFLNANNGDITPIIHRDLKNNLYLDLSDKTTLTSLSRNGAVSTDLSFLKNTMDAVNNGSFSPIQMSFMILALHHKGSFDLTNEKLSQEWSKLDPRLQKMLEKKITVYDPNASTYLQSGMRALWGCVGHTYIDL